MPRSADEIADPSTPGTDRTMLHSFTKAMASNKLVLPFVALCLFAPLFFSKPPTGNPPRLSFPTILTGDEPHYLLMLNSLLHDNDLDLKNNYASVEKGGMQAGKRFAGEQMTHHTFWFVNGIYVFWTDLFTYSAGKRTMQPPGVPDVNQSTAASVEHLPEYSFHPSGSARLLAFLLHPFRKTALIEPMAVFLSTMAIIGAMVFFRILAGSFSNSLRWANAVTAVVFLGTPVWHCGRTLYTEPYLICFTLGAYALFIRYRRVFLPGVLIALGMLMKPLFAVLALPLLIVLLYKKDFQRFILACLPLGGACIAIGFENWQMTGSPFVTSMAYVPGNLWTGVRYLWLSPCQGLLVTAPVTIAAAFAWVHFAKSHKTGALLCGAGFAIYFLLMALWRSPDGGTCYGPRLIMPVLGLFCIPLTALRDTVLYKQTAFRVAFASLAAMSVFINAFAAIFSWQFLARSPLVAIIDKLHLF